MSLIEQTIVNQVTIIPKTKTAQVQWSDQIVKDDEVIAENYRRKAYSENQKEEFLYEVDNAEFYVKALGWL